MNRATKLRKAAICSHEPRQHRRDKLTRIADGLTVFACKGFRVRKQISMHGSRQFNTDLDWSLVWKCQGAAGARRVIRSRIAVSPSPLHHTSSKLGRLFREP